MVEEEQLFRTLHALDEVDAVVHPDLVQVLDGGEDAAAQSLARLDAPLLLQEMVTFLLELMTHALVSVRPPSRAKPSTSRQRQLMMNFWISPRLLKKLLTPVPCQPF